jgi:hypothetical protein
MNKNTEEFLVLLKARYPLIWVTSYEEARVISDIKHAATQSLHKEKNWVVKTWSLTKGMDLPKGHALNDPLGALDMIGKVGSSDRNVFILKDFHAFLNQPQAVRMLRDLDETLRATMTSVVIVSPQNKIPTDLEKSFFVIDWDLPTREDVKSVANDILNANSSARRPENLDAVVDAALGLTLNEATSVFQKSLVQHATLSVPSIVKEKKQLIRSGGILEFIETTGNLSGIGGHGALKNWLKRQKRALSPEARQEGIEAPKGVLMVGLPGSGKSQLAKLVGGSWGMPTLRLDIGRIFQGLVGSSEENMRKAIKQAESCGECILWIDEFEKGFSQGGLDGGTTTRVLGTFLTWMQEKTSPVFVLATANDVEALPPELLRKERFDEIWFADSPSTAERAEIFKIHLDRRKVVYSQENLAFLARESEGFVGAEIESVVKAAKLIAFDAGNPVRLLDLQEAIHELTPQSRTNPHKIEGLRKWASDKGVRNTREADVPLATSTVIDLN